MKTDLDMTLYLVTDSTYHTEETFYKTIEDLFLILCRDPDA